DVIDRWRYHGKCVVNVHHVRFEVPHRSVEVTDLGGVPDRVPPRFPAREPLQLVVRDVVLGHVVAVPPQELVLGLEHGVLATALLVRVVDDHYPHLSTPDDLPASPCPRRESRHRQTIAAHQVSHPHYPEPLAIGHRRRQLLRLRFEAPYDGAVLPERPRCASRRDRHVGRPTLLR